MTVVKNNVNLKRLQRAVRRGDIEEGYGRQVARVTVDTIRLNWSGRYPPASVPGEPPAVRTGRLDRAIGVEQLPNKQYAVRIADEAYYWYFLEFGTSKMAARPFVRPAAEAVRDEAKKIAISVTNKVIT